MALNFPSNPSPNDTYTLGSRTWYYTGTGWKLLSNGSLAATVAYVDGQVANAAGNTYVQNNFAANAYVTTQLNSKVNTSALTSVITLNQVSITGNTYSAGYFSEKANIFSSGLAANVNYNVNDGVVHFHTASSNANATVNLQGFTNVAIGNSTSMAVLVTNGAAPKYVSAVQVDGTVANVTTKWAGGAAPTSGNASNVDIYSFSVIKTATLTYSIFASQNQFG